MLVAEEVEVVEEVEVLEIIVIVTYNNNHRRR